MLASSVISGLKEPKTLPKSERTLVILLAKA